MTEAVLNGKLPPPVRRSDGVIVPFDKELIVKSLLKETQLVKILYGGTPMNEEDARKIAEEVEEDIRSMKLRFLSGPLIRELVSVKLLEHGFDKQRNVYTRVGMPLYDVYSIDNSEGYEAKENANLQPNPETFHKKKADFLSKESYLLMLPSNVADAHLRGDIHIHDLEYWGTRPFCIDGNEVIIADSKEGVFWFSPKSLDHLFENASAVADRERIDATNLGMSLLSFEGFKPVKRIYRRRSPEKILEIVLEGGSSVRVSSEHRIVVHSDQTFVEKPTSEIVPGDLIPYTRPVFPEGTVDQIDLIDAFSTSLPTAFLPSLYVHNIPLEYFRALRKKGIAFPKHWPKRRMASLSFLTNSKEVSIVHDNLVIGVAGSEHRLPAIMKLTPLAKFIGLFIADGNYNITKSGSYLLVLTGDKSESSAVVSDFARELCIHVTESAINGKAKQFIFSSKILYMFMRWVLGIEAKAMNKSLPTRFLSFSKPVKSGIIAGLFYGDGSVCYRPEKSDAIITYQSISRKLIQQLALWLRSQRTSFTINELEPSPPGKQLLYRITMSNVAARQFASQIPLIGKQGSDVAAFLEKTEPCGTPHPLKRQEGDLLILADSGLGLQRVHSVREVHPTHKYVYDFVLDGDPDDWRSHEFLAGSGVYIHNCQDWDLRYFFYYGLMPDGTGTHTSVAGPAKHAEVAMLHAAKVLGAAQTNFAGGQGFFNFTVFMAPYLMEMDDRKIHQLAQMFLYEMTQLYVARGGQPVFSSIQIESGVPKVWQDAPVVSHGKVWKDLRYGDLEGKVHAFANALLDEYMKGDAVGKMFNFPKPEVVQRTRYWNDNNFEDIMLKSAQLSAKFGSTYYDNMIPAYRGGEDGVSCFQCCAYAFSEDGKSESFRRKILFEEGAHFSMGGMQVVTLNMPRLAYKSGGDEAKLLEVLRETMGVAKEAHLLKHRLMKHQFDRGLVPFASQRPKGAPPAVDIDNLSHTIGFAGVNEMVEHMTGYQLHEDQSAQRLALKVLIEMDKVRKEYSTEMGMKFSIARTPAESSAQRFAVADMIHYTKFARELVKGDLEAALPKYRESRDVPIYYTNGAHVNVAAQVPLYERLAIEQRFFPILKGGDIFHVWLGEVNPDPEALLKLNRKLATESWVGYWSHTKDITMCMGCGYVGGGLSSKCPVCGSESVKHYSRITGYYQDVSSWNAAKRQELKDRYRVRISA